MPGDVERASVASSSPFHVRAPRLRHPSAVTQRPPTGVARRRIILLNENVKWNDLLAARVVLMAAERHTCLIPAVTTPGEYFLSFRAPSKICTHIRRQEMSVHAEKLINALEWSYFFSDNAENWTMRNAKTTTRTSGVLLWNSDDLNTLSYLLPMFLCLKIVGWCFSQFFFSCTGTA